MRTATSSPRFCSPQLARRYLVKRTQIPNFIMLQNRGQRNLVGQGSLPHR